ncbi:Phage tail sheath protein [compost metagenome]
MPTYLTPGQYIEEIKADKPAQSVSTSITGFAGVTQKGRFGPVTIRSFRDFEEEFGGYIENSYLAYAVKGYFDNGGATAVISRVVHYASDAPTSAAASADIMSGATAVAKVEASSHGSFGNQLSVKISDWNATTKTFTLTVLKGSAQAEAPYVGLTLKTAEDVINSTSRNIVFTTIDDDANLDAATISLTGGEDGTTGLVAADYLGSELLRNGIQAFNNIDINLLAIPGVTDTAVLKGMEAFVLNRRTFVICDFPHGKTPDGMLEFKNSAGIAAERGAIYGPWIVVSDPIGFGSNPVKSVPPSGHIAGVFANTDANRGVFKSPAGETDGRVMGALGLDYVMDDKEQEVLNPNGINALRVFPGVGVVIWGARTLDNNYITVRRTADYVENMILANTRWTTFEPNDQDLWSKIKSTCEAFLRGLWRAGGLKGNSEEEAFYVICDGTTTTPDDVKAGRVFADIGISTQRPAEFIIFRVRVL